MGYGYFSEGHFFHYLHQPKEISLSKASQSGSITYLYDAESNKLRKQVKENEQLHTTDNLGVFQYLDGNLDFVHHAESYVKALKVGANLDFQYVYHYTDHLSNIRLSYGRDPSSNP